MIVLCTVYTLLIQYGPVWSTKHQIWLEEYLCCALLCCYRQ